jgi:hypothetical protein
MGNFKSRRLNSRLGHAIACAIGFGLCLVCTAQQSSPQPADPTQTTSTQTAPLPNAPAPAANPAAQSDQQQSKRIMGVLPNFRSVSAGTTAPDQTVKEKFWSATEDNFDYTSLLFAGVIAGYSFASKSTPEFHQGAAGYARYYWHTVADQAVENYFVEFIVPEATHEDSRYFAMDRSKSFLKRTGYSLSRVLVTRTDSGKSTFNISEIGGSAAAVSVSTFYYPSPERTVSNGLRNWGLDITYDALAFTFHEFSPDLRRVFLRKTSNTPAAAP